MNEDRDFPVLGRPYIVKLKGVWQEQIYIADQADGEMCQGERFWSREDLDECPSFDYEHDDWISIREAVSNRDQLAALKEENGRVQARVAELEGVLRDIKQHDIDETAKRILDGGRKFNYSLPLNIRERIAAALKEPANEG